MKPINNLPFWKAEDSIEVYNTYGSLIKTYYHGFQQIPKTSNSNVQNWIRYSAGIKRQNENTEWRLDASQYITSKLIIDAIDRVIRELPTGNYCGEGEEWVAYGDGCVKSLLSPLLASKSVYGVKEVINKLILNREAFERTRNSDITPIITILGRFKDQLSREGVFSTDELNSVIAHSSPISIDQIKKEMPPVSNTILDNLLKNGASSLEILARLTHLDVTEVRNFIDDMVQISPVPITYYPNDEHIITFKCQELHLWQLSESTNVTLHPDFSSNYELQECMSLSLIRQTVKSSSFSQQVEANVLSVCQPDGFETHFDYWHLPTDDAYKSGYMLWHFNGIPDFVIQMPIEEKKKFISGAIDLSLNEEKREILTKEGVLFTFSFEQTALDLFKLLKTYFHILCKRPSKTSCLIYGEGVMELVRNLMIAQERKEVIIRSTGGNLSNHLNEIKNVNNYRQIVCDLLLDRGSLTIEDIAAELSLDITTTNDLLVDMHSRKQVVDYNKKMTFSVDLGDLYSVINDKQIRKYLSIDM